MCSAMFTKVQQSQGMGSLAPGRMCDKERRISNPRVFELVQVYIQSFKGFHSHDDNNQEPVITIRCTSCKHLWKEDEVEGGRMAAGSFEDGVVQADPKPERPNRTLFVENLPPEATDTMLSMLFRQYPGFQEVRLIPGRNVAFADYQNEYQAGMAMQGLQSFEMTPDVRLQLSYARK
ncbi:unnamed protein product [Durusdinium trenchii]|uniref:RRM domain-containing protein n=1 Tax=Durusdinium trenchii TaxID=1381693 RepID=A0ABP0J3Z9_9DINO